jgi:choline dehydrogenase
VEEVSPWHRAFADAAGDDAIVHTANVRGTTRWNAGFAYLDPARSRTNLTIRGNTLVDRVLVEAGRAVGLATEGGEVRARTVVVAAGAYGSPPILLRSGLDPALPVGLGLQDHVGVGLGFEPTAVLQGEATRFAAEHPVFMAQVTIRVRSSRCEPGLWDLFHVASLEEGADGRFEASAATFVMRPRSRGSVRLASEDPRVPPVVDHGLLADPVDAEVLVEGIAHVRALAASAGIARLAGREVRPGADVSPDEHARTAARGFFHPTGTCAIGSVVDAECRVLGLEHLYVADASVMPEVPRVNTNLATAAVAERVADLLAGASG